MRHDRVPRPTLPPLLFAVLVSACGGGGGGESGDIDAGTYWDADAASDAADGAPDSPRDLPPDGAGGDLADTSPDAPGDALTDSHGDVEPDLHPDFGEAEVTAWRVDFDGGSLTILTRPFSWILHDSDGTELTRGHDDPRNAFDALAFGRADSYSARNYYDPRLLTGDGEGDRVTWYSVERAVSSTVIPGGIEWTLLLRSDDGDLSDRLATLTLTAEGDRAIVRVRAPDEPAWVHNSLSFFVDEGQGLYGFGELFDGLDARGTIREMQIRAEGESESATNEVHVPVPLILSTRNYAVFVSDRSPGAIDVAATRESAVRSTFDSPDVTYAFFADPSPSTRIGRYLALTGTPAPVPFWALAPQWWRNVNRDQAELLDDVSRARAAEIPSTVIWIDRPWSSYYHNWYFNLTQFPDPEGMFDELHRLGHRVLLHHSPQLNLPGTSDIEPEEDASEELYARYSSNGWLVQMPGGAPFVFPWGGGSGAFIDWSHPDAVADQQNLMARVTSLGAIGLKQDWDEYLQASIGDIRLDVRFANGETNFTMHGWYSALYHRATWEGFRAGLGEDPFFINRSGMPGDQAWNTCIWPGDLDNDFSLHTTGPSDLQEEWNVGGLPSAIMANQSLGLSGYPCFGSDAGGYRGGQPSEEVLLRWLAFSVFNAVMQVGGGGGSHMAWTADSPYSAEAVDITRELFRLRMRLVPWIYHWLEHARSTGEPLVRAMWLAYPDDEEARAHEDQFCFGPDMLVAPVYVEGATERSVYLPFGNWVDFATGERFVGGESIVAPAPLGTLPVFLREGGVLIEADEVVDTLMPAEDPDTLSWQDVRTIAVRLVPGAFGEWTRRFYNGVEVTMMTGGAIEGLGVNVATGAPDPGLDERFVFAPDGVVLRVESTGMPWNDEETEVLFSSGGAPEALPRGTDCTRCWEWDSDHRVLEIRLDEDGHVDVF